MRNGRTLRTFEQGGHRISEVEFQIEDLGNPTVVGYMVGRDDGHSALHPTAEEAIAAVAPPASDAPAPPREVVHAPLLPSSAGAPLSPNVFQATAAASPAQEATPPRETSEQPHEGWTKKGQPQEPKPEGESPARYAIGAPCPHGCGGTWRIATDELGCEFTECSNYPTCDYQVYTYEQSMAHTRAYALAHPEWRAEFVRRRGREPGVLRAEEPSHE